MPVKSKQRTIRHLKTELLFLDTSAYSIFCRPVEKIKELSLQDISYETWVVDHHFPELGTFDVPLIADNIYYDTKSHYFVVAEGHAVFRDTDMTNNSQIVDSVSISRIKEVKIIYQ